MVSGCRGGVQRLPLQDRVFGGFFAWVLRNYGMPSEGMLCPYEGAVCRDERGDILLIAGGSQAQISMTIAIGLLITASKEGALYH
jgi:hypothetical protein